MPPVKRLNQKARARSSDNARAIELRKERSRDAARNRRGKENSQFDELAKLLPLSPTVTSGLDKASIVKLTIAYLTMQEFSGIGASMTPRLSNDSATSDADSPLDSADSPIHLDTSAMSPAGDAMVHCSRSSSSVCDTWDLDTSQHLLEALGGFLLVLNSEGKILYVSETVSTYLGLSQVELTGSSLFNYVFDEDKEDIRAVLNKIPIGEIAPTKEGSDAFVPGAQIPPFFGQQSTCGSPLPTSEEETKPESFLTRMKCTLVRRGGSYSKSQGYRVIHFTGRMKEYKGEFGPKPRKAALIAVGQPLPSTNINELTLERDMFVSRVNMDLKIVYCEGRIHKFMDYVAKDIVGMSAYDFYHGSDVALIQGHHAKFLNKGQVWTKYYRWMNKNGGWVWMQTKASLIPHPKNPELKQMLCLNYIVSQVEHRGVVLGMAQMEHKPALGQFISEVGTDNEDPLFNDAQIDDHVMPFPQWNQNSDKLIPQPTLLDSVALTRSGYVAPLENDVFAPWGPPGCMDTDNMEEDLDEISNLIQAEMSDVDRALVNFVYNGDDDPVMPKLQPVTALLSSTSSSSTMVTDDGSFGRPKLEVTSPTVIPGCLANSLLPRPVGKQENPSAGLNFGAPNSCMFSTDRNGTSVQRPRMGHIDTSMVAHQSLRARVAPPTKASVSETNGLNSWSVAGVARMSASVVQSGGMQSYLPRAMDNAVDDKRIVDLVDEMEEEMTQRNIMAPVLQHQQQQQHQRQQQQQQQQRQQRQQQQHVPLNRAVSLPAQLPCPTGAPFPPEVKQEVVTPTSPQPSMPFPESFGSLEQQRHHTAHFNSVESPFASASLLPSRPMGHVPNRNGANRCVSFPLPNQNSTARGDANMNHLDTPANGGFVLPVNSPSHAWPKSGWQGSDQSIRALLTRTDLSMPPQQHTAGSSQQNGGLDARLCSGNPVLMQNAQNIMYQYGSPQ